MSAHPPAAEARSPSNQAAKALDSIRRLATDIVLEVNEPGQELQENLFYLQRTVPGVLSALRSSLVAVDALRSDPSHRDLVARIDDEVDRLRLDEVTGEIPRSIARCQAGLARFGALVHAMSLQTGEAGRRIDLRDLVAECVETARPILSSVAHLETELDPEPVMVACHRGQIGEVLGHLLINAGQAVDARGIDAPGHVRVAVRNGGQAAQVEVTDDGAGIPEEIRDRIFQPFLTTKAEGSGQGLAMAWTVVVERHGGAIEFDSELGAGTRFRIHLPKDGAGDSTP